MWNCNINVTHSSEAGQARFAGRSGAGEGRAELDSHALTSIGRLRARNAALFIADTEKGTTPLVTTADFGYFRLRDEGYSADDLAEWSQTVRRLGADWRDSFIYFKHEESGVGPALAKQLSALLTSG